MNRLEVDFADFAITALIFDRVFVESLRSMKTINESTRDDVARLSSKKNRPIGVSDLSRDLRISKDQAYGRLRRAELAKSIVRANKPEKGNRKLFLAASAPRFVPDPEKLFQELRIRRPVRFVHPITGERIVYRRKRD